MFGPWRHDSCRSDLMDLAYCFFFSSVYQQAYPLGQLIILFFFQRLMESNSSLTMMEL